MKGGGFKRWYGNQEYVVNWERDGKEIKNISVTAILILMVIGSGLQRH